MRREDVTDPDLEQRVVAAEGLRVREDVDDADREWPEHAATATTTTSHWVRPIELIRRIG